MSCILFSNDFQIQYKIYFILMEKLFNYQDVSNDGNSLPSSKDCANDIVYKV